MSTGKSVVDPKTLFDRWFDKPIARLAKLKGGDGGAAGMMIVLPLFERYIVIPQTNGRSQRKFYEVMATELQLKTSGDAERFWTTFRHGFCHTGMPLRRGRRIKVLPKVYFAAECSWRPEFRKSADGEEFVHLDPWKFIRYVMEIYRR